MLQAKKGGIKLSRWIFTFVTLCPMCKDRTLYRECRETWTWRCLSGCTILTILEILLCFPGAQAFAPQLCSRLVMLSQPVLVAPRILHLLLMILHLSCQSGWGTSSSSLQRGCAGMGAGRRVFCLSIGPRSSLGLCESWWQMVLPAGALPGHLSLFSLLPQGRDGTWHLWRVLGAVWHSVSSVTLAVFCLLCRKLIEEKTKRALDPNPPCLRYLCSHLFTYFWQNPFGLWLDVIHCFCNEGNDHRFMKMSLNDLSMARSGYLYIPEFLCGFF